MITKKYNDDGRGVYNASTSNYCMGCFILSVFMIGGFVIIIQIIKFAWNLHF